MTAKVVRRIDVLPGPLLVVVWSEITCVLTWLPHPRDACHSVEKCNAFLVPVHRMYDIPPMAVARLLPH